jgi:hypothetical protein
MRYGILTVWVLGCGLAAALTAGCANQPVNGAAEAFAFSAPTATIVGSNARLANTPREEYIGYWTDTDTFVEWPLRHLRPGTYRVQALYSLDPQYPLSTIAVSAAGQTLTARLASTNNWDDYRVLYLGTIKVAGPDGMLTVKATNKPMKYVMNLQSVILTPVGS